MEIDQMKSALLKEFRARQKRRERGIDRSITPAQYIQHLTRQGAKTIQLLYSNMMLMNSAAGQDQTDTMIDKMVNYSGFMDPKAT